MMTMQPTGAELNALRDRIHAANVGAGWWTDLATGESLKGKRSPIELLTLVHSEVSEAMEGDRKNLMDDKLPHRSMFEVELADAEIRSFDIAGGFDLDLSNDYPVSLRIIREALRDCRSRSEALGHLHLTISDAMKDFVVDRHHGNPANLTVVVRTIHMIAEMWGLDLVGAREEKLAFNAIREDHKIEQRKLAEGKKY